MNRVSSTPTQGQTRRLDPKPWLTRLVAAGLAMAIVIANLFVWRGLHPQVDVPDSSGPISGLAYNAFQRWDSPLDKAYPSADKIDADMALLAGVTRRIRTYSSSELPVIPALAEQHGLWITAGVWLDQRQDNNRREIEAVKQAVRETGSIERVIAGNEAVLHGHLTVAQLSDYLDELRDSIRAPVSTAEPWHVWLRYPQLARHVDFITVHLLPYWEGVPDEIALNYSLDRFEEVKRAFPGKHVVIGEIGWPSQGDRFDGAHASPAIQAKFVRDFLDRIKGKHVDYFLMEAIDQPWKTFNEGRVGAYWGIFHADRSPKFGLQGPIETDAQWGDKALIGSLLAFLPMLWFLHAFRRLRLVSRVTYCLFIQAAASLVVWLVALPFDLYLRPVDWIALGVIVPTLGMMVAILLVHAFEFVEMFWTGNLQRRFESGAPIKSGQQPFVSIHLACCNEPPEMVIATLDSLLALDYDNFEVLVIDNNTGDEALWQPVEAYVARLGEKFKFFHLPVWPGFKAGALNYALQNTDPRAEIVGVVDADYVVKRSWLKSVVAYFEDRKVGVVQAPQAHRSWSRQVFRRMMNWEYEGFFRIGMHHRNERDAIIQHGTMTLIRAKALREHGNWAEWCICEDAELGLRLMQAGYSTVYIGETMGEGLTPDDFGAFKKQRRRWALGAMQILKHHWRALVRPGRLSAAQRYHFVSGWLSWFGDALHLVFAFGAMFWTIGIVAAPHLFSLPIKLFMLPLFAFFACKALFGPLLYWRRVPCSISEVAGAALAGMALSHSIALGVFAGLSHKEGVFEVTRKGTKGASASSGFAAVREEACLLIALATCIFAMLVSRKADHIESALWIAILAMQAVPYAAALMCSWLSQWPEKAVDAQPRPVAGKSVVTIESGLTAGGLAPGVPATAQLTVRAALERPAGGRHISGI